MAVDTITTPQSKKLVTLAAQLALVGIELHVLPHSGGYLMIVRGRAQHCRTIDQLQAAAQRLGVPT